MYQYNPLLIEIKLDPSKVEQHLKDPALKPVLKQVKQKIHRNPFLRDKFYDITSLTHQTRTSNVPSIRRQGILRSFSGKEGTDTAVMIANGSLDPNKAKVVYTMRPGHKAPLDIRGIGDKGENTVLKLRIPNKDLPKRVADPMMPDYIGNNWQNYSIGKLFKNTKTATPRLDRYGNPLSFERFAADHYGMTPKQLRQYWSKLPSAEKIKLQKEFAGRYGHMSGYSKGQFNQSVRDTVALDGDIKPEWIVGSPTAKKYNFEDQMRQDPYRTVSMINDLMKRHP